jgi:predicted nucleotidyltransferase
MKLNFDYYTGQVFDLDQKTMNKMIEDVHTLLKVNEHLGSALQEIWEKGPASPGDKKHEMALEALK